MKKVLIPEQKEYVGYRGIDIQQALNTCVEKDNVASTCAQKKRATVSWVSL